MIQNKKDFLKNLERQATLQSRLNASHVFPSQLDPLMTLIGNYPWQFLLFISGVSAAVLFMATRLDIW